MGRGSSDTKSAEKKARALATIFEKRKLTLKKKAQELATLCAVPVAVVAVLAGGGSPDVWESEEGVLDRYRALPAKKRAEHTHARYLEDQRGKVTAKLARMRQNGPPALAPPDSMLSQMTMEELRVLLESIDAALLATAKRRKALGLPDEDEVVELHGHGVLCIGGNSAVGSEEYQMYPPTNAVIYESHHDPAMLDAYHPYNNDYQLIPESDMMQLGYSGMIQPHPYYNHQRMIPESNMMPHAGYYSYNTGLMQPTCNAQHIGGNYTLQNQMTGNDSNHHGLFASAASFQPLNATIRPTGFGSFGMEGYQIPPQGNGYSIPSREDWRNDAIELAEHPYMGMSSKFLGVADAKPYHIDSSAPGSNRLCTPAPYSAQVNGGNFTNPPAAAFWYMGTGGNVVNVDGREMQSSSNEYQYSGETSQNSSTNEEIHHLSDVAEARRQYWEN